MKYIPFSNKIEKYTRNVPIIMAFMMLSQLLIADNSIVEQPMIIKEMFENVLFKVLFVFLIAYTGTQDIETALLLTVCFIIIVNILRTKKERKSIL